MNSYELGQIRFDKKGKYLFYKIMSDAYNWKTLCDYPFVGAYGELERIIDKFLDETKAFFLGKVNDVRKENSSEK